MFFKWTNDGEEVKETGRPPGTLTITLHGYKVNLDRRSGSKERRLTRFFSILFRRVFEIFPLSVSPKRMESQPVVVGGDM